MQAEGAIRQGGLDYVSFIQGLALAIPKTIPPSDVVSSLDILLIVVARAVEAYSLQSSLFTQS
jgi:hypothetical protein